MDKNKVNKEHRMEKQWTLQMKFALNLAKRLYKRERDTAHTENPKELAYNYYNLLIFALWGVGVGEGGTNHIQNWKDFTWKGFYEGQGAGLKTVL